MYYKFVFSLELDEFKLCEQQLPYLIQMYLRDGFVEDKVFDEG